MRSHMRTRAPTLRSTHEIGEDDRGSFPNPLASGSYQSAALISPSTVKYRHEDLVVCRHRMLKPSHVPDRDMNTTAVLERLVGLEPKPTSW